MSSRGKYKSKYIDLDSFKGLDVKIECSKIIKQNADECCEDIKAYCQQKGWRDYGKGWVVDIARKTKEAVVHNKNHYQLTHLLEKGHLIVNKIGGIGFAAPHPHIKPAYDKARPKFIEDIKKDTDIDVEFKK